MNRYKIALTLQEIRAISDAAYRTSKDRSPMDESTYSKLHDRFSELEETIIQAAQERSEDISRIWGPADILDIGGSEDEDR